MLVPGEPHQAPKMSLCCHSSDSLPASFQANLDKSNEILKCYFMSLSSAQQIKNSSCSYKNNLVS